METEIIVAIIAAAGGLLGSLFGVMASSRLTNYRIGQLEKKVDKHNSLVERTYRLEQAVGINQEKIKVANHRIEDLEGFHKQDSLITSGRLNKRL